MPTQKYYTPDDFKTLPNPNPNRQAIIDSVNAIFKNGNFTNDLTKVTCVIPVLNYTKDDLMDFCNHYCFFGHWQSVTYQIKTKGMPSSNNIVIFEFIKK